jgi:hypothetical protein
MQPLEQPLSDAYLQHIGLKIWAAAKKFFCITIYIYYREIARDRDLEHMDGYQ